jgi:hopanoid biosynthesis associated RND transporter like protein HpnN
VARRIDAALGDFLVAWVNGVRRRAAWVIGIGILVAAASLVYAAGHLGVNANSDELFDESLRFRQLHAERDRAFPLLRDVALVVIDATSRSEAEDAAKVLVERLQTEGETFASVYAPGVDPFFDRNGLLYLSTDDLEELADHLAAAQPFLAELSRDRSIRGLFDLLTTIVERAPGARDSGLEIPEVLDGVRSAVRDAARLRVRPRVFGELILGEAGGGFGPRSYVAVQPRIDFGDFAPGHIGLRRLREIFEEFGWNQGGGIRARITGDRVLQTEELDAVRRQAAMAGLASFLLVAMILLVALRSLRLILATLLTLAVGLACTAGFAALAIGHLNMISVAFAVLFIGLGVDFGIHFSLRYREAQTAGFDHSRALGEAARDVGSSLVLCAFTTAIGFYAFIPTGYVGVAELGVISGTGMFISLFASLTVLPAFVSVGLRAQGGRPSQEVELALPSFPTRHPRIICTVAALLATGALLAVPRLHFDANPLRVRDPAVESVRTFDELVEEGEVNPWRIEILARDLGEADALTARLRELGSVDRALTLSDSVPADQEAKLLILEDVSLFLGLPIRGELRDPPDLAEQIQSVAHLRDALVHLQEGEDSISVVESAAQLVATLDGFLEEARHPHTGEDAVAALETSLVGAILERVERLELALTASRVTLEQLPAVVKERLISADGRALVEVYPTGNLNDDAVLERFVEEVRSVAPDATGTPVYMLDSARVIVAALQQAFLSAFLLIAALLWLIWRNLRDLVLVMAPLTLAGLLTGAVSVLAELPINFADVIVLPLLLGIGVDSGIHLVHRHRSAIGSEGELLATSTSRAVFWSALTTIASFGSLAFASHRGMASLGQLLTLGIALMLIANLIVLPALIVLVDRKHQRCAQRAEGERSS